MSYPILAANSSWYKSSTARSTITQINIVDTYTPTGSENESWNADTGDTGSIKCYLTGTVLTIAGNGSGKIAMNEDSNSIFAYNITSTSQTDKLFISCTAINGLELFDSSAVTNLQRAFAYCISLTELDLSMWDVSNVTTFRFAFAAHTDVGAMSLRKLNLSGWNVTSACTSLRTMFQYCPSLAELDVSNWDVSKVTDMRGVFHRCSSLTNLDVSKWDTSSCTDMLNMFYGCESLTKLDVSNWDTSEVTNMTTMFSHCTSLTELNVSNWNTGKVATFASMFSGNNFVGDMALESLDVSNWDTSSATSMSSMFYGCGQLTELDLHKWDVSKVTNMYHMFADCFKLETLNLSGWNAASLTNIDGIFNDCNDLKAVDVSGFNTSNVTDFHQLFERCYALGAITGLDKWDTSKGTTFSSTFIECYTLKELDLSSWDTSLVTNMDLMFQWCTNLEKIYVSDKWSTSGLVAGGTPSMFKNCYKLVGGNGTSYEANHLDYTTAVDDTAYAVIDGKDGKVGYLTDSVYLSFKDDVLLKGTTLYHIAEAIRSVSETTTHYYPSEMKDAILAIKDKYTYPKAEEGEF